MTVLYDATDVNASLPKPADKVWAMYDGPNCPTYIERGRWYEVESEYGDRRFFIRTLGNKASTPRWENCQFIGGDNWHRHVGPTPPDAKASIFPQSGEKPARIDCKPIDIEVPQGTGRIVVTWDETSPNDWHPHDGRPKRPKRPKGVGKRDTVEIEWSVVDGETHKTTIKAGRLLKGDWACVTSYRITERAPKKEKRRKVWVFFDEGDINALFENEKGAMAYEKTSGRKAVAMKEVKQ